MPCCKECNQWKADSYSGDFGNKISNIYMHQMNDKIGNKFMWRFVKRYLDKQMTELYSRAQDQAIHSIIAGIKSIDNIY